jgi:transposase InsO family protein
MASNSERKRFSKSSFRSSDINLDEWPMVDVPVVKSNRREETQRRISAIRFYLETDASVDEVEDKWGVSRSTLFHMLELGMQTLEDGSIVGFRAAIPYARFSNYNRSKPDNASNLNGVGSAGLFSQLRLGHPELQEWLDYQAKAYKPRKKGGPYFAEIHEAFLQQCKDVGIREDQYPLNRKVGGVGVLRSYLIDRQKFFQAEKEKNSKSRAERDLFPPMSPLDEVQVDGHNLDVGLVVSEKDAYGQDVLYEISRIWIIVVIDSFTRCVLGYSIALGHTYDHIDLLQAIFNSLAPHQRPMPIIAGAKYHKDGGFPSENHNAAWRTWLSLKLDNAMAHKARHVQEILSTRIGCLCDFGPPHEPNDRAIIERFFEYLIQNFSHRIVGSTGSNTMDELRERLAPTHANRLKLLITLEELREVVDIVISDYNGRPHSGIQGHAPLALFNAGIADDALPPDRVVEDVRREREFLMEHQRVRVKSSAQYGGAYVNFCYLKYRNSNVLRSDFSGVEVSIGFLRRDISSIWLFDEDGTMIGILTPPSPWCDHPHSLTLQAEMQKALRAGQFEFQRGESILHAYRRHKSSGNTITRKIATSLLKNAGSVSDIPLPSSKKQPAVPVGIPRKLTKGFII